jgi:DNA-binding ferritin-like protein (Dps family)
VKKRRQKANNRKEWASVTKKAKVVRGTYMQAVRKMKLNVWEG